MFHTKICGVQSVADIQAVAAAGGDAIGLNFFPDSIRFVDPESEKTQQLSAVASEAGLLRVGVFVNETPAAIMRWAHTISLDAIQLHGDEPPEIVYELGSQTDLPLIRAIKLPISALPVETIIELTHPWIAAGCRLLFDADAGNTQGGSGQTLDWKSIQAWSAKHVHVAWTLAGGLRPDNIKEAVSVTGAKSVDVASGVEQPRGKKSGRLIQSFLTNRFAAH